MSSRYRALLSDASFESVGMSADRDSDIVELCAICENIFFNDENNTNTVTTHRIVDVIASARTGCGFCKVLWSSLDVDYNQRSLAAAKRDGTFEHGLRFTISYLGDRILVEWGDVGLPPRPFDDLICEILLVSTARLPVLEHFSFDTLAFQPDAKKLRRTDTSSPASLRLAQAWIQYCDDRHSLCSLSHTLTRNLPTRLIEIGGDGLSFRLRNGSELLTKTPYLTLSHCWGTSTIAKLSRGSPLLEGRSQQRNTLSATLQDAINFAESLRHRYICIDSLCIIEDSNDDLQLECSRMWEVYGNSYCTIAATASSDGSGGLFREHDAGGPAPCKIKPLWENFASGDPDELAAGYHFIHDFEFIKSIEDSPLCRRAWVTQERLLSPRIMHFGHNQIWWECRELCASETYPQGVPAQDDGSMKQKWDPLNVSTTARPDDCYEAWSWCISYYSKCLISHPEDRLVALAGVARQIGQALQNCGESGTHLAGLWKDRLLSQLMWTYSYGGNNGKRSSTYRTPSWSWASVDGAVSFMGIPQVEDLYFSKLVSYSVSTPYDSFGAIIAGQIRICGH